MAGIETFNEDVEVITKLEDEPNAVGGMTADELKAAFDQASVAIKGYLNGVVVPGVNGAASEAESAAEDVTQLREDVEGYRESTDAEIEAVRGDVEDNAAAIGEMMNALNIVSSQVWENDIRIRTKQDQLDSGQLYRLNNAATQQDLQNAKEAALAAMDAAQSADAKAGMALPKSGGTMSGNLNLDGYILAFGETVQIYEEDENYVRIAGLNGDVRVHGVAAPQADNDAANKKYVEERVAPVSDALDLIYRVNKGQTYDITHPEVEGHAELPDGGLWGTMEEIYGRTEQDGVPSPDNPIEIKSVESIHILHSDADGNTIAERTIVPPRPLNAIVKYRDRASVKDGVWKYAISYRSVRLERYEYDIALGYRYKVNGFYDSLESVCMSRILPYNTRSGTSKTDINIGVRISPYYSTVVAEIISDEPYYTVDLMFIAKTAETLPIDPADLVFIRSIRLAPGDNLFITDNWGRDVSYILEEFIDLKSEGLTPEQQSKLNNAVQIDGTYTAAQQAAIQAAIGIRSIDGVGF